MYGISPSVCCMKAKGASATGLPCKAAAVLRAPLATKRVSIQFTRSYKVLLRRGEPGGGNLHPAPTSLYGILDYAHESSGTYPRSVLSTTTHKFHVNKSSYTTIRGP